MSPCQSIGVHGSDLTHSLPHAPQANSGSPPTASPVADHAHSERQPEIVSGRVGSSIPPFSQGRRTPGAPHGKVAR